MNKVIKIIILNVTISLLFFGQLQASMAGNQKIAKRLISEISASCATNNSEDCLAMLKKAQQLNEQANEASCRAELRLLEAQFRAFQSGQVTQNAVNPNKAAEAAKAEAAKAEAAKAEAAKAEAAKAEAAKAEAAKAEAAKAEAAKAEAAKAEAAKAEAAKAEAAKAEAAKAEAAKADDIAAKNLASVKGSLSKLAADARDLVKNANEYKPHHATGFNAIATTAEGLATNLNGNNLPAAQSELTKLRDQLTKLPAVILTRIAFEDVIDGANQGAEKVKGNSKLSAQLPKYTGITGEANNALSQIKDSFTKDELSKFETQANALKDQLTALNAETDQLSTAEVKGSDGAGNTPGTEAPMSDAERHLIAKLDPIITKYGLNNPTTYSTISTEPDNKKLLEQILSQKQIAAKVRNLPTNEATKKAYYLPKNTVCKDNYSNCYFFDYAQGEFQLITESKSDSN